MLGDAGLAYADDRREVAGTKLVVNEDVNEGETCWICQGTKEFGHRAVGRWRGKGTRRVGRRGRRDAADGADICEPRDSRRHSVSIHQRLRNRYIVRQLAPV